MSSANIVKSSLHPPAKIFLNFSELSPSYASLQIRTNSLMTEAALAAAAATTLSSLWLLATAQPLIASPVAISFLVVGGATVADRALQCWRINRFVRYSLVLNPLSKPSESTSTNKKIQDLIARENPKIAFTYSGLQITPRPYSGASPTLYERTLEEVRLQKRLPIPECVLNSQANHLSLQTMQRWVARINVIPAIINLISIASKDRKHRKADDYIVGAASAYNLYDFMSGPSVRKARQDFTDYLAKAKSPEHAVRSLIKADDFENGGMSFLKSWVQGMEKVAVRVGRTGTVILYKDRETSFGGPYPIHTFPQNGNKAIDRSSSE